MHWLKFNNYRYHLISIHSFWVTERKLSKSVCTIISNKNNLYIFKGSNIIIATFHNGDVALRKVVQITFLVA